MSQKTAIRIILILVTASAVLGFICGRRTGRVEGRRQGWREGLGMECSDGIHKPWRARKSDNDLIVCRVEDAKREDTR